MDELVEITCALWALRCVQIDEQPQDFALRLDDFGVVKRNSAVVDLDALTA